MRKRVHGLACLSALMTFTFAAALGRADTYTAHDLYTIAPPPGGYIGATFSSGNWNAAYGGQMVGNATTNTPMGYVHAVYWNSAGVPTDINPGSVLESTVNATDGLSQAGGSPNDGKSTVQHALVWHGTAASAVDLNPYPYATSVALAVHGNQQAGWAALTSGGLPSAFLWNGSAASAVNLNPTSLPNINSSEAFGTNGVQQVGVGGSDAMLWSGTAASAVDLAPPRGAHFGYSQSYAYGLIAGQQVGAGYNNATNHYDALMWSGSAASLVDLNGVGYVDTQAYATNGTHQVGLGSTPANNGIRALVWSGTADSAVDLGSFLAPGPGFKLSEALSIDADGNIFGYAVDSHSNTHAIEWSPVTATPEPTALVLLGFGCLALLVRRHTSAVAIVGNGWRLRGRIM